MEDEKEVPHLTLDNFHLDSQVGLFGRILLETVLRLFPCLFEPAAPAMKIQNKY